MQFAITEVITKDVFIIVIHICCIPIIKKKKTILRNVINHFVNINNGIQYN